MRLPSQHSFSITFKCLNLKLLSSSNSPIPRGPPLVSILLSFVMGCYTENRVKVTTQVSGLRSNTRHRPDTYRHLVVLSHSQLWHVFLCPSNTVCSSPCPLGSLKLIECRLPPACFNTQLHSDQHSSTLFKPSLWPFSDLLKKQEVSCACLLYRRDKNMF